MISNHHNVYARYSTPLNFYWMPVIGWDLDESGRYCPYVADKETGRLVEATSYTCEGGEFFDVVEQQN